MHTYATERNEKMTEIKIPCGRSFMTAEIPGDELTGIVRPQLPAPAPDPFASLLQYIEDGAQYFFLGGEGRRGGRDSAGKKPRLR